MKKIIILLICFVCSASAFSQATQWRLGIDSTSGNPKLYHDTIITKPNLPNYYFNGYGAFANLRDTVRTYISYTGENYLSYNSTTGVFTGSAVNLSGTNVTSTLPIARGGTNNGSLSVTNGNLFYSDGSKLVGLGIGTSKQKLGIVGGVPAWIDSTASGTRESNNALQTDTVSLIVFGGGGGNAGDTSSFTTSTIYGAVWTAITDTLIITKMVIGLQGTSASVTVDIFWNDSLNVSAGATKLVAAGSAATNLYTGTSVTSFDNTKIPPSVFIWCKTSVVTTKPTFLTVTLMGYKKRVT